jgi:hypothetical protein
MWFNLTNRRKNVTTITVDDQLIEEVISVTHCQNAQEAIINVASNHDGMK